MKPEISFSMLWSKVKPLKDTCLEVTKELYNNRRNVHIIFATIYFITAVMFFIQVIESYRQTNVELTGYDKVLPESINLGGVSLAQVVNGLSLNYNQNIERLESELEHSATITFVLNLFSLILTIASCYVELRQYAKERSSNHEQGRDNNTQKQNGLASGNTEE